MLIEVEGGTGSGPSEVDGRTEGSLSSCAVDDPGLPIFERQFLTRSFNLAIFSREDKYAMKMLFDEILASGDAPLRQDPLYIGRSTAWYASSQLTKDCTAAGMVPSIAITGIS